MRMAESTPSARVETAGETTTVPAARAVAALTAVGGRGDGGEEHGRDAQAAAREAVAEEVAGAAQAAGDAADRPAQRLRGLGVRLAFEVAEDDGEAIALRQAGEFLVDDRRRVRLVRANPERERAGRSVEESTPSLDASRFARP